MNATSRPLLSVPVVAAALLACTSTAPARQWMFAGVPRPVEAEFVAEANGYVVLRGENGKSFEVPLANLSQADRQYVAQLSAKGPASPAPVQTAKPVTRRSTYQRKSLESVRGQTVTIDSATELHVSGGLDAFSASTIRFAASDSWLFLPAIKPSEAIARLMDHFIVNGQRAVPDSNIRVARHAAGSVIIPHSPGFPAMTVFEQEKLAGTSLDLRCHVAYDDSKLAALKESVSSFILRRGYMATIASEEDGTGTSRNYVAQDHDLVIESLPPELDNSTSFVRVFPWQWTSKKGIAGGIHQDLNVGWFYDWNIGANSTPDLEYVAIKQKRGWPSMRQDWKSKGINHLLGFNEPDRPDQAKLTVDEAISLWPELLGTGLRLGSPATSDGGLNWLYQFIDKADEKKLRVDFVAVHYYRATADPGDAKGAADQMFRFLKGIHDRVKRPLWVTEWNNGANWTTAPDPNERQQKAAIKAMIEMLDETPFVERYALYNWVEKVRHLKTDDGSLTPAGEAYRDHPSPVFFIQPKAAR